MVFGASLAPLVRSATDANATPAIDSIALRTRATEKRIFQLHWRAGRHSVVQNATQNARGPWPGASDIPHARAVISDHGGGRWYGYLQGTSWDCMDEQCRQLRIDGTTEPLSFYMYHHQYMRVDGGPLTELRNAQNVSFYGQKTETVIPGREDKNAAVFPADWPVLMTIEDSSHIAVYGEEGPSQAQPGRGLFEIVDSSDVTLVHVGRRQADSFYGESSWHLVKETRSGTVRTIDATGVVGLFRRN